MKKSNNGERMKKTIIKVNPMKGRGVYAAEAIEKGEVIEVCHLIVLNFDEVGPFLEGYVFDFNPKHAALALGNGSLYNHSNRPNAKAFLDTRKKLLHFQALKPIKIGEEITINYGYGKSDRKKFNIR